mgnify:CR=1 FL=1
MLILKSYILQMPSAQTPYFTLISNYLILRCTDNDVIRAPCRRGQRLVLNGRRNTLFRVAEMAVRSSAVPHVARQFGAMGSPSSDPNNVACFIIACRHIIVIKCDWVIDAIITFCDLFWNTLL